MTMNKANSFMRKGVIALAVLVGGALAASARPVPRTAVVARLEAGVEVYGIVHWGLNTYTDREWGYGDEDPALLAPDAFDADQVAGAAKAGGLRGLVVVAKHHDGFCLWPTATTAHSVARSPFRGGAFDYVKEMSEACRRAGLLFGVYCSPWDRNAADYASPSYVETYHAQLRELLDGRYGEVFETWFDGANGGDGYYGGARETRRIPPGYYRFGEVFDFVYALQPKTCTFGMGGDFRWPGNERGELDDDSRATCFRFSPDLRTMNLGSADGDLFSMCEADFPLRPGWFYHARERGRTKGPAYLMQRYLRTVGNGGTMNLGLAPDRRGRLDDEDVAALRGFGELWRAFFSRPVTNGPANVVVLREDVSRGERITGWTVSSGGRALLAGKVVGNKRIRVLDAPVDAASLSVAAEGGPLKSVELFFADPALVRRVREAKSEGGETDTAKWMTGAHAKGAEAARKAEELVDCPVSANLRGHENIEWSTGYGFGFVDSPDLPRVLLVGDSICNGYQKGVREGLKGELNVSYWISSYCVTSPGYLRLLAFYLDEAAYSVIHFNNGLHSLGTDVGDWERGLEAALRLIRLKQPRAKIVWAASTPLRDPAKTEKARQLNAVAQRVIARLGGIETDDLFTPMDGLDRDTEWNDTFHFKAAAQARQAQLVIQAIRHARR